MKDKLNIVFKLQSQIYKFILFLFSVALIVYLIPKNSKFQYDHDSLFANNGNINEISFDKIWFGDELIEHGIGPKYAEDRIFMTLNPKHRTLIFLTVNYHSTKSYTLVCILSSSLLRSIAISISLVMRSA